MLVDSAACYYDFLAKENHDPVYDPEVLRTYMDQWDGPEFIERMDLNPAKSVLEIGVGTGRLALRTASLCGDFTGIDPSPETLKKA